MKITYLEKGPECDFKRRDKIATINLERIWKVNNLLYGYVDRYNVKAICLDAIIETEDE